MVTARLKAENLNARNLEAQNLEAQQAEGAAADREFRVRRGRQAPTVAACGVAAVLWQPSAVLSWVRGVLGSAGSSSSAAAAAPPAPVQRPAGPSRLSGRPPTAEPTDGTSSTAEATDPTSSTAEPTGGASYDHSHGYRIDGSLATAMSGLPSKIVAGGRRTFVLKMANSSGTSHRRVDCGAAQYTRSDWEEDTSRLRLQVRDMSGYRQDISLDGSDPYAGCAGHTGVRPHDSFSLFCPLSIDVSLPAGTRCALGAGTQVDENGERVVSGGGRHWEFRVTAPAGATQQPTTGVREPPAKPADDIRLTRKGHLARTGRSSALPAIGDVFLADGARAIPVVRRRENGTRATAA